MDLPVHPLKLNLNMQVLLEIIYGGKIVESGRSDLEMGQIGKFRFLMPRNPYAEVSGGGGLLLRLRFVCDTMFFVGWHPH